MDLDSFENDYFREKQKKKMFENNLKTENKVQELFFQCCKNVDWLMR